MTAKHRLNMKILFHTSYYPPEIGAAQTRTHELAQRLKQIGHEVSVLTSFPNYPSGVVPKQWRGHLFMKQMEDGIPVYRVWSVTASTRGFVRRAISDLSLAASTTLSTFKLPKVDVVIVESHPLFSGNAGVLMSLVKGARCVLTVSDLWPDSAIQMGKLKNPFLIWIARAQEGFLYRHATLILAMTEGIYDKVVADGIPAGKVLLFRNAVDAELFRPGIEAGEIRAKLNLPDNRFVVLYAGTFGSVNNVSAIVEAAALFHAEDNRQVHFIFVGEGADKEKLTNKAEALGIGNVSFVDPVPKHAVPQLLNAADCVVISLNNHDFFRGYLPRKMFEAMACGKPVVVAAKGEAEKLVLKARAGLHVHPENVQEIHDAILRLCNNPEEAKAMGRRGRNCIQEHFSTERRAFQLNECLRQFGI
jgi:glycosyltransferase involved in cell wall biosynthesis